MHAGPACQERTTAGLFACQDRGLAQLGQRFARNELKAELAVVVHDHAADVFTISHRLVADIDVIEIVRVRDELVELELTVLVHAQ